MKYMVGLKNTDTDLLECIKKNKENIYEVYLENYQNCFRCCWGDSPGGSCKAWIVGIRATGVRNQESSHRNKI